MDAKLQEFISSFLEFLNDVQNSTQSHQLLVKQNEDLKNNLQTSIAENEQYKAEILRLKQEVRDLLEKNSTLNAQRRSFTEELSKDMVSQGQVVKLKYEVEILMSRMKSLERELQIHKCDNERLNRENQNLKRGVHTVGVRK